MARLICLATMSLDGYIADEHGNFDWTDPGDAQHAFINDLVRPIGTHLYGRRMYEVMTVWETDRSLAAQSPITRDFAEIWQAADKIVYSKTLSTASTARTRIEREFDPEEVRRMKATARRDMVVGGSHLASHAIKAGLVEEYNLFIAPMVVGAGNQALPNDIRLNLELEAERRFERGMVYLQYRAST